MKSIVLARVSDKTQDSNEAQISRVSEYVKHKDLDEWKTIEIEESSTKGDRKKFQEVIKTIEQSDEPIALVVDTVDRLQRSFKESVQLDELRKSGKLEIHFYRENLVVSQKSNSADLLRWDMAVMFARSYVLQLSDNVKRKIEQKLKNGEWPGKAPNGYKNITLIDGKTKDIIPDSDRDFLIVKAFEWYATGQFSMFTLRKRLKAEGLTTNTINKNVLSQGHINDILKNPFYYGVMRYRGELYPHRYKPLISKELFDKVQAVRMGWHKKPFKYASKPFPYRGLAVCSECGCTITPETVKGKYIYYHCTQYHGRHNAVWLKESELTEQFKALLNNLKVPEKMMDLLKDSLKKTHESESNYHKNATDALKKEDTKLKNRLEVLYLDRLDGRITVETYDDIVKSIKEKQAENIDQQRLHSKADETFYLTASRILDLANRATELFESSEAEEKRQLLQFVLQKTELKGKKLEFTMKKPFDILLESAKTKDWLRE